MKITKRQLRRIIKEELSRALKEQGASDEVRPSPPRWSTGGEDPWQPTSTRWTGMPSRGAPGSEPGDEAYLIFAASVLDEELQKAGLAITDAGAGDKLTITLGPDSRFAGTRIIVQVIDAEEPS